MKIIKLNKKMIVFSLLNNNVLFIYHQFFIIDNVKCMPFTLLYKSQKRFLALFLLFIIQSLALFWLIQLFKLSYMELHIHSVKLAATHEW